MIMVDAPPQLGSEAPPAVSGQCPTEASRPCWRIEPPHEADPSEAWSVYNGRPNAWNRARGTWFLPAWNGLPAVELTGAGWSLGPVATPTKARWIVAGPQQAPRDAQHAKVVRVTDGAVLADIELPSGGWEFIASPDGSVLLLAHRVTGTSMSIDTKSWTLRTDPVLREGELAGGSFNASGTLLYTVAVDGSATLRKWPSLQVVQRFVGDNSLSNHWSFGGIEFFENDQFIASVLDSLGRLYDVETGQPVGAPFPADVDPVAFVVSGAVPQIVTKVNGEIIVWNLDTKTWFDLACQIAGRNMTKLEWETYGPKGARYHATCPQWPAQS
jgi:hypothetical protein